MDVEEAIRTRRTHKVYGSEPVDRAVLTELLELGRWAPNHHLTNPWRFRVLGPEALERLKAAVGAEGASKLDRAPTLVAVSCVRTPDDPVAEEEDLLAAGCAAYAVLLGAHNRGLAGYWRTPAILREPAGRAALDIPDTEHCIGLLHLGPARQEQHVPERAPLDEVISFLA
ncbi:MAG: nitroreductase [Baekduia sp.]